MCQYGRKIGGLDSAQDRTQKKRQFLHPQGRKVIKFAFDMPAKDKTRRNRQDQSSNVVKIGGLHFTAVH